MGRTERSVTELGWGQKKALREGEAGPGGALALRGETASGRKGGPWWKTAGEKTLNGETPVGPTSDGTIPHRRYQRGALPGGGRGKHRPQTDGTLGFRKDLTVFDVSH